MINDNLSRYFFACFLTTNPQRNTHTESYIHVYTPKTHTLYEYHSFAVRQRDLAERELHHRHVAVYWRSFLYHVRRVVCLRRTHRERWVSLELALKLVSLDRMSCKRNQKNPQRREERFARSRVDRDRPNVQILFSFSITVLPFR